MEIVPLKGGKINTVLHLAFDQPPYQAVIKLNTPAGGPYALHKEAAILRYLRKNTQFPCPLVYAVDATGRHLPFAYLLLECLPGDNLQQARASGLVKSSDLPDLDRQLAGVLLDLHSHGNMSAFWSQTDEGDEQGFRAYGVVGRLDTQPEIRLRLGVYGYWFPIPVGVLFDGTHPFIDAYECER